MPDIGTTADGRVLDRRIPTDFRHVERHPLGLALLPEPPLTVERVLNVPRQYAEEYDQGQDGACVGYSQSWMMSVLNRKRYDAFRLYVAAQGIDEWPDTPPQGGTSLRAGFDVLRTVGHWQVYAGHTRAPRLVDGIDSNKWARSVDEIRTSIAAGLPVNLGINWYRQFSDPVQRPRLDDHGRPLILFKQPRFDYWVGIGESWGPIEGGHAITTVAASDRREAVGLCNTWGTSYPFIVWLPYRSVERLLSEDGEAGVIVDRPNTWTENLGDA
jgi:hypothetical protein